jgi:hypothetical protein
MCLPHAEKPCRFASLFAAFNIQDTDLYSFLILAQGLLYDLHRSTGKANGKGF